jgi:lipopolysaccharide transport system permease protein
MTPTDELPLTTIDGRGYWSRGDAIEIWRFRELFWQLTLRDIKLRYKQTVLGFGWSIFQPLSTILVFVIFIGWIGKAAEGMDRWNYLLFVIAGVLPWTFFNSAVLNAGNSFVNNEQLVSKVYFPRLALPISNVLAALFDWLVCLVLFGLIMALLGVSPTWRMAFAPLIMALFVVLASAFGILLSALIAEQRDFRYLLQFGMQLWMFATPGIYLRSESIPEGARQWIVLNPVQGYVTNFRACVLGPDQGGQFDWLALGVAILLTLILTTVALVYFRRVDRTLADKI